jgi:Helix-hairpin-helix containing domain
MVFLHSHGVGTARAVRIFKTYGADAVQVMTENPYRLARDIRGIRGRARPPSRLARINNRLARDHKTPKARSATWLVGRAKEEAVPEGSLLPVPKGQTTFPDSKLAAQTVLASEPLLTARPTENGHTAHGSPAV